jgi:hypothetical protein
MKLDFLMLADNATFNEDSGKLDIVGGGPTHIKVDNLPYTLERIFVAMRFFINEEESLKQHAIGVKVVAPDGGTLADISGVLERGKNLGDRPTHEGEDAMFIVIARLGGFVLALPGRYAFEVSVDDSPVDVRHVLVVADQGQR